MYNITAGCQQQPAIYNVNPKLNKKYHNGSRKMTFIKRLKMASQYMYQSVSKLNRYRKNK